MLSEGAIYAASRVARSKVARSEGWVLFAFHASSRFLLISLPPAPTCQQFMSTSSRCDEHAKLPFCEYFDHNSIPSYGPHNADTPANSRRDRRCVHTVLSLSHVADRRYFVKVTVNRPSLFSRNLRHIVPFVFCPVEPPRPPAENSQIFVRKKHTLSVNQRSQESGIFGGIFGKRSMAAGTVAFEVRLPNPPILVPTEPIPMTFILKRDADSQGVVYVRTIQVMLGIKTLIAAQGYRRELGYLLPLVDVESLNITLRPNQNQITIHPEDLLQQDSNFKGLALPDTIPPSFRTCNIARKYTLVLYMGVTAAANQLPEQIQLTCDVQVFSGFKPPRELIPTGSHPEPSAPNVLPADAKVAEPQATELPTYDEAVAETLGSGSGNTVDESRRGRFEVDASHLQGADSWDDEKR